MSCLVSDREDSILLKTAIFHVLADVACGCIKLESVGYDEAPTVHWDTRRLVQNGIFIDKVLIGVNYYS